MPLLACAAVATILHQTLASDDLVTLRQFTVCYMQGHYHHPALRHTTQWTCVW
jgi:hypothetical protein